jgi:hypothetical protein
MVAHVDSMLPRAMYSLRAWATRFAIITGLRVVAVARVKRSSRIGTEQTPYPIRPY